MVGGNYAALNGVILRLESFGVFYDKMDNHFMYFNANEDAKIFDDDNYIEKIKFAIKDLTGLGVKINKTK